MTHFIFDFDGTLVDSEGILDRCLRYALKSYNIFPNADLVEKIRHKHPDQLFDDFLSPEESKKALGMLREMGKELSLTIQAFDGIEEIIEALRSKDIRLAIWTGRDGRSAEKILTRLGLNEYFERVVSGTCVPVNKPGLDGLVEISRHFSAEPKDMVMIGDHHHDIEPANEMGCFSIHAKWKRDPHQLPEGVEPNECFDKTADFFSWIQN